MVYKELNQYNQDNSHAHKKSDVSFTLKEFFIDVAFINIGAFSCLNKKKRTKYLRQKKVQKRDNIELIWCYR